jgi:two-component SAPR family response regulator
MKPLSLDRIRILIVEDNFVVANALKYLIDGYGGSVAAMVPTLERAFEVLAAEPIDIAVLDIDLNGTSVVPLAEHLRAQRVPFVFLTGYGDEALLPEPLRGHPRFDKPVEAERLVRGMLELVSRKPQRPLNGH